MAPDAGSLRCPGERSCSLGEESALSNSKLGPIARESKCLLTRKKTFWLQHLRKVGGLLSGQLQVNFIGGFLRWLETNLKA